jgi:serine/threonine protein phosphatase PrpC
MMNSSHEKNDQRLNRITIRAIEGLQIQGSSPLQEDYLELNSDRGIFILADGFGGSSGVDAAHTAVKCARQFMEQEAGDLDATLPFEIRSYFSLAGNVLFNAIAFANRKVNEKNHNQTWSESGGASLLAAYLEGNLFSFANVGCCSVYLKRGGKVKEIVTSRSWARQVDPFAGDVPGSSIPLMSLGTAKQLEPEITEMLVLPEDQILIQTSGVNEQFRKQLFQTNSIEQVRDWFEMLVAEEQQLGAQQNTSLVWIQF